MNAAGWLGMVGAVLAVSAQALPQPPAPSANWAADNAALRALLQHTPRLLLQESPLRGWTAGRVSSIAASRDGLIYLLQRGRQADPVIVLNSDGRIVRSWGRGLFTTPHGIRLDPEGHVWTTDAGSSVVYEFSPEGKVLLTIAVGGLPIPRTKFCGTTDIAFAPNGDLFVADGYRNARIVVFTPQGRRLRQWGSPGTGPGQFKVPHAIQIDEQGIVYVADRENGRIQRFDLNGKYLGEWSCYGKTFGLKLEHESIWLSSFPRGAEAERGWLLQVDRRTGRLLGYVDTTSGHGIDVTSAGDVLAAAPGPDLVPLLYRRNVSPIGH